LRGRASDKCQREKRKTINGEDLIWAMGTLGFEDYVEPLKVYLEKYREVPPPPRPTSSPSLSSIFLLHR
jgi:nuclear transcription Y subunit beta